MAAWAWQRRALDNARLLARRIPDAAWAWSSHPTSLSLHPTDHFQPLVLQVASTICPPPH